MAEIPSQFSGPGLVDLQVNGYAGFDFNSDPENWTADDFRQAGEALNKRGVVAALPTIITDDAEAMLARARKYAHIVETDPGLEQTFPGLHIEGPFISSEDGPRGAHPKSYCRSPNDLPGFLDDLMQASEGRICLVTLAPELKGSIKFIKEASHKNICVGLGHTQADIGIINQAVQAGAKLSTHLGNASHQLLPRHDNYIQAQLANDSLMAGFIADGHHIPFFTLKNFIRAKSPERSILVTDAISAAEIGAGIYKLGNEKVVVREDLHVSKPGQSNLAGSALTLDRAVINVATHCDVPFEAAWHMASTRPASLINLKEVPDITVEINNRSFLRINYSD
jgi:N-acetylglucosamine-6-phosphate deacetylase